MINPDEASKEIKDIFEKNDKEFKDVVEVRVVGDYENIYKIGKQWEKTQRLYLEYKNKNRKK